MQYKTLIIIFISGIFCPISSADGPRLGQLIADPETAIDAAIIWPDGTNLPAGQGDAATGAEIYQARCIACHGSAGRGGPGGALADGDSDLTRDQPDQTIGTYWPYPTTLFDFIRRAMPLNQPWSLSDDEVYALVAYLLVLNDLIDPDTVLDAGSLKAVDMPNARGFDGIEASWP